MSDTIVHLTDSDFEAHIAAAEKPVLVDFWAEWCGPCRAIAPLLHELAGSQSAVSIAKLDIQNNPEQPAKLGIMSIPTLILFSGGKEAKRVVGADPQAIRTLVSEAV